MIGDLVAAMLLADALVLDRIETTVKATLLRVEDCQATRLAAEQAQTDAYIKARRQAGISMIR